jgi:hypothetical protein
MSKTSSSNSKSSDSFASHFASLVPEGTAKKNVKDFVKVNKVDIRWQGDPVLLCKDLWFQTASYARKNDML